jgi:DNA repair protein RadA
MQPDKEVSIAKSEFTTAMQHYINTHNTIERISTGSKNIYNLLYGGVETRAVTEFYGAPNSGKTQLCHTMSALVPQDISNGGVCGKSIYIDTEGTFRDGTIGIPVTYRFKILAIGNSSNNFRATIGTNVGI